MKLYRTGDGAVVADENGRGHLLADENWDLRLASRRCAAIFAAADRRRQLARGESPKRTAAARAEPGSLGCGCHVQAQPRSADGRIQKRRRRRFSTTAFTLPIAPSCFSNRRAFASSAPAEK